MRVCFFAHYHQLGLVSDHVLHYLSALRAIGFKVVVVSTASMSPGETIKLREACAELIVRENVGLDFGGWIEAFQRFSPLNADLLLLTNDSIYGPISDLDLFVKELTSVTADFYGAVECLAVSPHLQSWFLMLRPSAYNSQSFRSLMESPISKDLSKWEIILNYEIGLTKSLLAEGLTCHPAYSPRGKGILAERVHYNPTHVVWRDLIERWSIPFLKIELLRFNPIWISNIAQWRGVVAKRNPALALMIETDLNVRGSVGPATILARLRASIWSYRFVDWPELQPFLINDHLLSVKPVVKLLNAAGYYLVRAAARLARPVTRGLLKLRPIHAE